MRDHGLICSMGYAGGGTIPDGLNVTANHDAIVKNFEQNIPRAAALKVPNVITFFGNRRGMPRRGGDRQLRRRAEPRQEDRPKTTASRSASSC